ncbi:MAG TPA: hypothetical protein VHQ43_11880 [Solirubrobacterales bacterium]|jgi:hypothetical protein|nr:hypothetical protein [Solirubrobacterales bacterium]
MTAIRSSRAHTYGLRPGEVELDFPCDRFLPSAEDRYYRAVDVAAPPTILFRWLCQLRVAPYSYDWLDNFGRRSPRQLTPGLERLAVHQRFMTIFDLVEFEPDVRLTLLCTRLSRIFGEVACTYLIVPRGQRGCRLLVKVVVSHPGTRLESALRARLLPYADLFMMRKQLHTLRELAERGT